MLQIHGSMGDRAMTPHSNPAYALERIDEAIRVLATRPGGIIARVSEACLVLVDLDCADFPAEAGDLFDELEAEIQSWPTPGTPPDTEIALRIAGQILDLRVAQHRFVLPPRAPE